MAAATAVRSYLQSLYVLNCSQDDSNNNNNNVVDKHDSEELCNMLCAHSYRNVCKASFFLAGGQVYTSINVEFFVCVYIILHCNCLVLLEFVVIAVYINILNIF